MRHNEKQKRSKREKKEKKKRKKIENGEGSKSEKLSKTHFCPEQIFSKCAYGRCQLKRQRLNTMEDKEHSNGVYLAWPVVPLLFIQVLSMNVFFLEHTPRYPVRLPNLKGTSECIKT